MRKKSYFKGQVKRIFSGKNKNNKHRFFGFYGKSPWSKEDRYFVFLEAGFMDRHPKIEDKASIVLVDLKEKKRVDLAKTKSWNWQQGCMLQWLGPNFNSKIIFNDLNGKGRPISRILDIKTRKEDRLDFPIYDVDSEGKYALSMDYGKLGSVREGYGYKTKNNLSEEGVLLVDLERNEITPIIKLEELKSIAPLKTMKEGKHWIDQPTFSPDGKRICFLHRWKINKELFHTRFFTANVDGSEIHMFPDSGFYSHFCWKNNEEILMFCSISEKFGSVRKGDSKSKILLNFIRPIYRKMVPRSIRKKVIPIGYYLLKDRSKNHKKIDLYDDDGHPSFSKDKKYIITDTYPNKKNYRKLILYNDKNKKRSILGKFFSLPKQKYLSRKIKDFGNSPYRVDLHPRWNFKGTKICFDSVHEGKRDVYWINLEGLNK